MANFTDALPIILLHEGLYSDDPKDLGGPTKYGVSLRAVTRQLASGLILPQLKDLLDVDDNGYVDAEDVKLWDAAHAEAYYRAFYWPPLYNWIQDQAAATKLFDLAVNVGPTQAHRLLQRALQRCGRRVDVDGVFGNRTLAELNAAPAGTLLLNLRAGQAEHYARVVIAHPTMEKFLPGWMIRAVS